VDLDFDQLKELIKLVGKSQLTEFKLEGQQLKLYLSKAAEPAAEAKQQPQAQAASQAAPPEKAVPSTVESPKEAEANFVGPNQEVIVAPMVGTFYRAPSPDAAPFIDVGSIVEVGTTVCIIEAMKLMNEIKSEVRGRVVDILVENAHPVEYGQTMFLIAKE